ncbi:hypothetical protein ACHAWT_009253 [Skeletonema menzelii]
MGRPASSSSSKMVLLAALLLPHVVWAFVAPPPTCGDGCSSCRSRLLSRLQWTVSDYLNTLHVITDDTVFDTPTKQVNTNNFSGDDDDDDDDIIKPMSWGGGNRISKNMYHVALPKALLQELRTYANDMGITDFYRGLIIDGPSYNPGQEKSVTFQQQNWMVHRPKSHWKSNMHWLSPADETAHDDYLTILSSGGFDQVLDSIGAYFNLDSLSAYHLSFIGVSQCERGFIHTDVNDSGVMAFNLIIPLMLVEGEGPELEILSDDETTTRYYQYEYNVASMIGDGALHATASCDYMSKGEMRLCATVYVGDIAATNVRNLLMSLTQAYPPVGNAKHLLDRAGDHWSKTDVSKRLPVPMMKN